MKQGIDSRIRVDKEFLDMLRSHYANLKSDKSRTRKLRQDLVFFFPNKRGSSTDITYLMIAGLMMAIIALLVGAFYTMANNKIQAMDIDPTAQSIFAKMTASYSRIIDNTFGIVFFGLAITSLILASMVRVHWVFIPFYIVVTGVNILLGGFIANFYSKMVEIVALQQQAEKMVIISSVFAYLPWVVFGLSLLLMFVMYKAGNQAQTGG